MSEKRETIMSGVIGRAANGAHQNDIKSYSNSNGQGIFER